MPNVKSRIKGKTFIIHVHAFEITLVQVLYNAIDLETQHTPE